MKVEIDGVRYVPDTSIKHEAPENVMEAVRAMLMSRCLYGTPNGARGEIGAWWDVLRLLAGDQVADLAVDHPREAYVSCGGDPES